MQTRQTMQTTCTIQAILANTLPYEPFLKQRLSLRNCQVRAVSQFFAMFFLKGILHFQAFYQLCSKFVPAKFCHILQNSAFQPSRGRLLYIHPVGWSSRFVTINSTSIKPSIKVRNQTYYIFGESL